MGELAKQVINNLNHHHLWTNLSSFPIRTTESELEICRGMPPEKLHPDDTQLSEEYILPVRTEQKWTVRQWKEVFEGIRTATQSESVPRRVVMAMVTNDGTVVYYFINNGLVKPRKN
jgi:tRNA-splicing endonuclease subunit Sen15